MLLSAARAGNYYWGWALLFLDFAARSGFIALPLQTFSNCRAFSVISSLVRSLFTSAFSLLCVQAGKLTSHSLFSAAPFNFCLRACVCGSSPPAEHSFLLHAGALFLQRRSNPLADRFTGSCVSLDFGCASYSTFTGVTRSLKVLRVLVAAIQIYSGLGTLSSVDDQSVSPI